MIIWTFNYLQYHIVQIHEKCIIRRDIMFRYLAIDNSVLYIHDIDRKVWFEQNPE